MTQWEAIIGAIISPRARAAAQLGLEREELWAAARLAALEAQQTWRPDGGTTASAWVWTHVAGRVSKIMFRASRELAADTIEQEDEDCDLENEAIVRQSLAVLRARLGPGDYRLLWFQHALGYSTGELAELYQVTGPTMRQWLSRARRRAVTLFEFAA